MLGGAGLGSGRGASVREKNIIDFIGPTVIRADRGQPRHSQFYPQSIRRIVSLGNGPKGGLRGAIRKKRVPKGVQIDSRELVSEKA